MFIRQRLPDVFSLESIFLATPPPTYPLPQREIISYLLLKFYLLITKIKVCPESEENRTD